VQAHAYAIRVTIIYENIYVVMFTNQVLHSIAGRGDTNNKEIIYISKMDELSW